MQKKCRIRLVPNGITPVYKTDDASCADCWARVNEQVIIGVGKREKIPLGFALELPIGYEAVIRGRSGLSAKGIDVAIGTIDADYRGEVMAVVINNSTDDFVVSPNDRICQIKIQKAEQFEFEVVEELSETKRGEGGFGHTGV